MDAEIRITQLECFVAAARYGSFTEAAKCLFLSPQTVSKHVHDLERGLSVQLFERDGRSVAVTPTAQTLAAHATEVLDCIDDFRKAARLRAAACPHAASAALAVAYSPHRGNVFCAADFDSFSASNPGIGLECTFRSSGTCLSALEERVVDAAIVLGSVDNPAFACIELCAPPVQVVVASGHPLARRRSIRLADLAGVPIAMPEDLRYCYRVILRAFQGSGVAPHFVPLEQSTWSHRAFLDGACGALLAMPDPGLLSLYPRSVVIPLAKTDRLLIPLSFVYDRANPNPVLPLVERHARLRAEALLARG